jgi:hypothetical protein
MASVQNDCLETYIRSGINGMDAVGLHKILPGPSAGMVPTGGLHGSRSTASTLSDILTVRGLPAFTIFCLTETVLQSAKDITVWMTSPRMT